MPSTQTSQAQPSDGDVVRWVAQLEASSHVPIEQPSSASPDVESLVAMVRDTKSLGLMVQGDVERPWKKKQTTPPESNAVEPSFLEQYLKAIERQKRQTNDVFTRVDRFCEAYSPNVEPLCKRIGVSSDRVFSSTQKGRFTPEVLGILTSWFSSHVMNPYPDEEQRSALLKATGLSQQQLKNWFINHRKRSWQNTARVADAPDTHTDFGAVLAPEFFA